MSSRKFQRTTEDFVCEHCNAPVHGSGYTNHCPQCLWCKHVDINPGDRKETCRGLMRPLRIEPRGKERVIIHTCLTCHTEKRNKVADNDNFDAILALSKLS